MPSDPNAIYRVTSIVRLPDPRHATNKAVLLLLPLAAAIGATGAILRGDAGTAIVGSALL